MATLGEIEKLTKDYSEQREKLAARVKEMEHEVEAIKLGHMPGIRRALEATIRRRDTLQITLEASPELFEKPRTITISGIKVGFAKGKDKLEFSSAEKVVKLIKKHFEELVDLLVNTTEKPDKKALGNLSKADLKKLGVTIEETGDQVVIKSTDSELDKFISALLGEKKAEAAEDAA